MRGVKVGQYRYCSVGGGQSKFAGKNFTLMPQVTDLESSLPAGSATTPRPNITKTHQKISEQPIRLRSTISWTSLGDTTAYDRFEVGLYHRSGSSGNYAIKVDGGVGTGGASIQFEYEGVAPGDSYAIKIKGFAGNESAAYIIEDIIKID